MWTYIPKTSFEFSVVILAAIYEVSFHDIAKITTENSKEVFGI